MEQQENATMTYDREVDAVYVRLRPGAYAFGCNLDADRRIDFAADERPIGVELLGVSHGVNLDNLPERDTIAHLLEQHHISVYA
jgi:hypothetical protein